MPDGTEQTTTDTATPIDAAADLIPRVEAKKAFEARDKAKREADELRKRALSQEEIDEYQGLKAKLAQDDEDRKKKAGEFEALKQSLITKHTSELEIERKARVELETSYRQEKIEAAFLGAVDWFGGDGAKTILTGDMANAYLGKYVSYEDVDVAGKSIKTIVVRDTDGNIMLDGKGNPARFADAIGELIQQLPNRDRILRGSGKTGSGNSGGVYGAQHQDFIDASTLTPEQARDPNIIKRLQAQVRKGGQISGRAYN